MPEPPNRLRYSKNVRLQHFAAAGYIYVGTGSEHILRAFENDGELFVFTLTRVYRVVGSNGNYRAIPTGVNQGLRSAHAICRGIRSLYMHCYDGVYEFPAGRKVSEPINQVFFGENVNGIDPVYKGRESETAMAFWDSKVYFSYPSVADGFVQVYTQDGTAVFVRTTNDRILVWDTLYERWHYYLYGAQSLFLEPENNILVGANLLRREYDSIAYGDTKHSGPWPMQLEQGFADVLYEGAKSVNWIVDTREYDLGMPDQEKRFIDFVLDADTQGQSVQMEAGFDSQDGGTQPDREPLGSVSTVGRQRAVAPVLLNEGEGKLAYRVSMRISGSTAPDATSVTRLYKLVHRVLVEPPRHRTFVTDWDMYGHGGPKFFTQLWAELKTFGKPLKSIEIHVDNKVAQTIDAANIVSSERAKFYFGLHPDIRGTLARIKISPLPGNEVVLYDHGFQVIPEPPFVNSLQTPYELDATPYLKVYKHISIEIDTENKPIPVNFWVDGKIADTFSVTADGRQAVVHSFDSDLIGKLRRLTIDEAFLDPIRCCRPIGFRFYGASCVIDPLPPDVTRADTYETLLSFDRYKILGPRLWLAFNSEADLLFELYIDNILRLTKTIEAVNLASGYSKVRVNLPSGLKGRLFRPVFSSPLPFQIYADQTELQLKGLDAEDGWTPHRFPAPQTM